MDLYIISLTIIGLAGLSAAWIPPLLSRINISYSIIYVLMGYILYSLPIELPWPNPIWQNNYAIHLTELVIIIALMGIGLKIDHPFSFKEWRNPFRLATITMLLSILAMAFVGWYFLGLHPASALLLGAALAPTDPVLASEVQVGPPQQGKNDEVRFSLTAEAGLNDGMAFPFTWLAVALAIGMNTSEPWLGEWLWKDLGYRIIAGVASGFILGKAVALIAFKDSAKGDSLRAKNGFVAVSTTLFVYGLTELISGYGFVAVFVSSLVIRNYEMGHEYHKELHGFTDQIERFLLVILLILFGGTLATGLLDNLTIPMAVAGISFVLVLRPLAGLLGLLGSKLKKGKKLAISFFGIKGIGSFFYLSFGLSEAEFENKEALWALVGFVVLFSIIIHGLTVSLSMKKLGLRYTDMKEDD